MSTKSLSHYTREQKIDAATHYAIYGSLAKLERDLDIPKSTSCTWNKNGDTVWHETIEQLRTENAAKNIAQYNELTNKALDKANKAIDNLPDTLTASDIKSLVVSGATTTDKSLLLQGKATSISGKSEGIAELRAEFMKLSSRHNAIERTIVDEQ